MTQSTILAPGQAAGTSTDVVVTTAAPATVGIFSAALGAPTAGTLTTDTTGGELVDGTYYYRVSAINAVGESTAFAEEEIVVPAGTATNIVTIPWTKVVGATGYRIYGRATGAEEFIAEVGDVDEYVDDGSITPDGALPAADTTLTGIHPAAYAVVWQDTPGADVQHVTLSPSAPVAHLTATGTYRVVRPDLTDTGCNLGVFKEVDA